MRIITWSRCLIRSLIKSVIVRWSWRKRCSMSRKKFKRWNRWLVDVYSCFLLFVFVIAWSRLWDSAFYSRSSELLRLSFCCQRIASIFKLSNLSLKLHKKPIKRHNHKKITLLPTPPRNYPSPWPQNHSLVHPQLQSWTYSCRAH